MADVRKEWLLAAAALVALAAVVLVFAPAERQMALDHRLSTLRTTTDGAAAVYELLQRLDVPVERRRSPLTGIRGTGAVALLAPTRPLSPLERDSLLDWVRHGGTLLAALHPHDPLLEGLGLASEPAKDTVSRYARPTRGTLTAGVDSVGPVRRVLADTLPKTAVRPLSDVRPVLRLPAGELVALRARLGDGSVFLVSEPRLLANERIEDSGIAPVFARVAADATARGGSVRFDEYHHGHTGGTPSRALASFAREQPAGRMSLQLALVALLALLPAAVRLGSPVAPRPAARRSPLEHVAALGEVYRQARAEELARRRLVLGLARRLGRERPPPGGEAAFLDRLRQGAPVAADAVEAVRTAWDEEAPVRELASRIDEVVNRMTRKS